MPQQVTMGRIEVGRYGGSCGGYTGWMSPERDTQHKVPAWMLFVADDGHVDLGVRDDAKDELVFPPCQHRDIKTDLVP
jgi:hypothetical protein